MNETEKRFLENRFLNLDARCTAIEHEFIDYMETAPKPTNDWIESRLRALEIQVKELGDAFYKVNTVLLEMRKHVNILRREVQSLDPGVNLDD